MTRQQDSLNKLENDPAAISEILKEQSAALETTICKIPAVIDVWQTSVLRASKIVALAESLNARKSYMDFWSENSNWFSRAFEVLKWKIESATALLGFENADGSKALVTADIYFDAQTRTLLEKKADAEVTANTEANPEANQANLANSEDTNTAPKLTRTKKEKSTLYKELNNASGPSEHKTQHALDHLLKLIQISS
ncbi:hypothetical protein CAUPRSCDRAFT_12154 [Caulochytrium protostelioides]|uniref:Uncharacterized protein n=1 Tax=Caulochytrium protostelioides TaxID=1555241 RepID=A0A4P9WVJ4_9FUNG|nr:hypothetical protein CAUPRSCDRAFT_12154 [Caulochytrium protostelioides]